MSPPPAQVWIDGRVVEASRASIPVTDHGFLYGDGIFEGIRVEGRRVLRLERHLDRFRVAARALALELPADAAELREIVLDTARAYGRDRAYLRLIATRGEGPLGVDPGSCPRPRLLCIADELSLYPPEKAAAGIDLVTSSLRRPAPDVLDPRVKSLNYLNSALAKLEARQRGADDALLLNASGAVAEASVANVFAWRGAELLTPPASDGALEGITRGAVLELAPRLGLEARVATLGRFDLLAADEVFLTGSGAGVVPVRSLDARPLGAGPPWPVSARIAGALAKCGRRGGTPL